jgi:hypothetical protein
MYIAFQRRDRAADHSTGSSKLVMNNHPSIADIHEHELVDELLSSYSYRSSFIGIHGMPSTPVALTRVLLKDAPGDYRGDIDILLFAKDEPARAVAIEVKRIKVGASAFWTDRPNKMHEINVGVEQANLLAKVGFAQVYLYLIVVVDSREHNEGRITYNGLTAGLRQKIDAEVSTRMLDPRVGLIVLHYVQSMDHPPLTMGSSAGTIKRLATETLQPPALSRWIGSLSLSQAV